MANSRYRIRSEVLPLRAEAGQLLLPESLGSEILNMYYTEEGTLRSVWGPAPYVPDYGSGYPSYQTMKGIFHARLGPNGERDVLLAQWGDQIRVFEGWKAGSGGGVWRTLLGPAATSPQREATFDADKRPRFPAQFVSTPAGIVIIPAGDSPRPYFYDGDEVLPLGYASTPGAPLGLGPKSEYIYNKDTASFSWVGPGRIGHISLDSLNSGDMGRVSGCSYRAAVQWVDRWGNLSAISGKSASVISPPSGGGAYPENFLYPLLWTSIEPGPEGTIGRMVYRTKDEIHSGTLELFEMSAYSTEGFLSFATLPDNLTRVLPDNTPDDWLIQPATKVVPMTPFKLFAVAMGRGWAADLLDDPAKLHPTMPGRMGTLLEYEEIYPDPRGSEITGLHAVAGGLLVFTEGSTFFVTPNVGGEGFATQTLHATIGCVAPSSLATLPSGQVLWLGREGFFAYTPSGQTDVSGQIELVSSTIDRHVRGFNKARMVQACAAVDTREGVYRCWVADQASITNNICWEFSDRGWKRRSDVEAAAVCVKEDHTGQMLVAGRAHEQGQPIAEGVWALDRGVESWQPATRTSRVKTAWLRATDSKDRGSPLTVFLWLRARDAGNLTVKVRRDWNSMVTQTTTAKLHPADTTSAFWDTTLLGSGTWEDSRPYWTRVDIFLPSAEVFQLSLEAEIPWEFIGLATEEVPKPDSFRSSPR